jgi:uncharacterized membrane protein
MLDTFNLTPVGAFHTAISLLAVLAGIVALVRYGEITTRTSPGVWYVRLTAATCITGLFIFRHGGFGAPHALAIITLVVLAITYALERAAIPTGPVRYVIVLGNSLTLFFHWVPAITETGTRLPLGHPLFSGPEDRVLQAWYAAGFLVYLIGAAMQVRKIRRNLTVIA